MVDGLEYGHRPSSFDFQLWFPSTFQLMANLTTKSPLFDFSLIEEATTEST